jgi:O-antigen biosynthesis protein
MSASLPASVMPVSLVIVSRNRPQMLRRCLLAVGQLDHPAFEVVVVADPVGQRGASDFPVKTVACDTANISVARNLGVAAAAGSVVAFLDDDAVPEPQWLRELCAPFSDPQVVAAGGFVLGRNGISFQWKSGTVDASLVTGPLSVPEDRVSLHPARPGLATEIKGVNCAYRRDVLARLGGFDPELRYYLDETELNLRLAAEGGVTAIVPMARVHHAKAASLIRRADLAPRDLWDVGASSAVTLRRHQATEAQIANARTRLLAQERVKLLRHMVAGGIEPGDVDGILATLKAGFADGSKRPLRPHIALPAPPSDFRRFPIIPREVAILTGRVWQGRRLRAKAAKLAKAGAIIRLFLFSPTSLFHRIRFSADGYWLQTGGVFGKSARNDRLFSFWTLRSRVERENRLWDERLGNT